MTKPSHIAHGNFPMVNDSDPGTSGQKLKFPSEKT